MNKIKTTLDLINRFIDVSPQKAAQSIEEMPAGEAAKILKALPTASVSVCLTHMQAAHSAYALAEMDPKTAAGLISMLSPHTAAEIILKLPETLRKKVAEQLKPEFSSLVRDVLSYPNECAGRLMRTDYTAFHSDMKVSEVISRLRVMSRKNQTVTYCYVIGQENRLLGVLNMRDLLLASPASDIASIMRTDMITVSPFTDREHLIELFSKKHYLFVPVVDETGKILGVVNTERLIQSTEEEATEDIQILFGASPDERVFSGIEFKIKQRLPWLMVNLATAFLAGWVVSLFESLIAKIAVLAVFLPIIAGQGGNAGTQSLAVILRGMIMREVKPGLALRIVSDELKVALANGAAIGLVTGVAAWIWKGNPILGLVVFAGMLVNMLAAGFSGAIIPLLMKRFGFDPAHSSAIFVTTVTDVVGFFAFLGMAYIFSGYLVGI